MRQTLQLGAMSTINIGATIMFQWLVLTMLGPGAATDALFAALTVPQIFAAVIGVSLSSVLTPLLAGEDEADQHRDAWTLLLLCGVLFVSLAAILMAAAPWWVPLTVAGFSPANQKLTVHLAFISLAGIVFTGVNAVQSASAFARGRYIWVDAAPAIASLVVIGLLPLLMPHYGVYAAAALTTGRLFLQSLLMSRVMGRPIRPDIRRPILGVAWRRIVPLVAGASYYKMDPLVDRYLLSALAPGSLSLFYLAQQLWSAASQVLAKALGVPAITRLSVADKAGDRSGFVRDLVTTMIWIITLAFAGWLLLAAIGKPVIAAVLTMGRFTAADATTLWWLLILSGGLFVGGSAGTLAAGAYYAQGDTKTPTILGSIAFTGAIVLKIVLFRIAGIAGLAIAVSLYLMFSLVLLLAGLYRQQRQMSAEAHR